MAEDIRRALDLLRLDCDGVASPMAGVIRQRGDRRRTAVRAAALGGTAVLVATTAGTAVAVGHGSGGASLGFSAAGHNTARPVSPQGRREHIKREIAVTRKEYDTNLARLSRLHARHRAGHLHGQRYHAEVRRLQVAMKAEKARLQHLRRELAATHPAVATPAPTASPTSPSAVPTRSPGDGYRGLATPTPTPTNGSGVVTSVAPGGPEPTATPTPSRSAS